MFVGCEERSASASRLTLCVSSCTVQREHCTVRQLRVDWFPAAALNQNIAYDMRLFHARQTLVQTAELESEPAVVDS